MSPVSKPIQEPVHIMIDLETLDTVATAVILSMGACIIGPDPMKFETLYIEIDTASQPRRTKSAKTIQWWEDQGNCPRYGTTSLVSALLSLRSYLERITVRPILWCKGTDFDIAILNHTYAQLDIDTPWKYNDVRDFRTIKKMFGESMVVTTQNLRPHHALSDAVFQAQQLYSIGLELK
jgi:hypothetical protein